MKYICATSIITFVLGALTAAPASAALMHPDVMGTSVWFRSIVESSPTGDPLPLYGQPATSGDQLLFPTTGSFAASSMDGGPSDQTDGKMSLMIVAKPGFIINSFGIAENGFTILSAPFGSDAYAEVDTFAVVKVVEVGGAPVNIPAFNALLNVAPLGGQYQLSIIGGDSYSKGWIGNANVGLPNGTTKVNITLNNNVFAATSGLGTRAIIDKKFFEIDVDTGIVPEPTTGVLFLIGMLLAHAARRGRRG